MTLFTKDKQNEIEVHDQVKLKMDQIKSYFYGGYFFPKLANSWEMQQVFTIYMLLTTIPRNLYYTYSTVLPIFDGTTPPTWRNWSVQGLAE